MNRIVITGIGAVTPMGNTFQASWKAACSQRSGIAPVTRFSTSGTPWKVCGELKRFDPAPYLSAKEMRRLDPFAQYAVEAARMAAEDAGLISSAPSPSPSMGEGNNTTPPLLKAPTLVRGGDKGEGGVCGLTNDRLGDYLNSGGVIVGSSRGGIGTLEKAFSLQHSADSTQRKIRLSPYLMPSTTISMAASYTAQKLGLRGYCLGISNACSSGTNAIGEAYRLIRAGFKGPVFAGGTDAPVCLTCLEGYGIAGALSKNPDQTASRPFDRHRDGCVLSEGACVIVLE
ncbi:MAG: beta-ketoacyl synthase N-terminal-like domain-containing protein, partial [Nitrospirota bacterium]|nr:beta-ketoacyl synthase N-terminal-like domain-containing protein [Nitrospirota bacterium]